MPVLRQASAVRNHDASPARFAAPDFLDIIGT